VVTNTTILLADKFGQQPALFLAVPTVRRGPKEGEPPLHGRLRYYALVLLEKLADFASGRRIRKRHETNLLVGYLLVEQAQTAEPSSRKERTILFSSTTYDRVLLGF
jgi:hypothetical protein